jgi:hypothetical protein
MEESRKRLRALEEVHDWARVLNRVTPWVRWGSLVTVLGSMLLTDDVTWLARVLFAWSGVFALMSLARIVLILIHWVLTRGA